MADITQSHGLEKSVPEGIPAVEDFPDEMKAAGVESSSKDSTDQASLNDGNGDLEGLVDEVIHHPANKDDVLTHTIHVQDDPTLNALTFRTWFLGMRTPSGLHPVRGEQVTHSCV
jgi:hypothetical protein